MYKLHPPPERTDFLKRNPRSKLLDLTDANGNIVYEDWPVDSSNPRPLKKLSGLPIRVTHSMYQVNTYANENLRYRPMYHGGVWKCGAVEIHV